MAMYVITMLRGKILFSASVNNAYWTRYISKASDDMKYIIFPIKGFSNTFSILSLLHTMKKKYIPHSSGNSDTIWNLHQNESILYMAMQM